MNTVKSNMVVANKQMVTKLVCMNSFPMKQAGALIGQCMPEFAEIIRFHRMMQRESGNADHLLLQGNLLHEEGVELLGSGLASDRETVDALCDIAVVAVGYLFLGEVDNAIQDGSDMDLALIYKGSIFNSCANCYGDAFAYVFESGSQDAPFLITASLAHAKEALWGVAAYCVTHGIDLKKHLQEVNKSNFSKFCLQHEYFPTVDKYKQIGVSVYMRMLECDLHACYVLKSVTGTDGKFYPAGKLLESIGFKEPSFDL